MSKPLRKVALAAVALLVTACASVTVTTDYDRSTQFSRYHTYALAHSSDQLPLSPSSEAALSESLRASLATHGLREANTADLNVVSHVFTKDKIAVYPASGWGYGGYPYRYGRYGMWAGAPATYNDVSQYTEGTLVLDFVDAATRKLVFRGVAKGTVGDPEANARKIREAVQKIVHDFPAPVAP